VIEKRRGNGSEIGLQKWSYCSTMEAVTWRQQIRRHLRWTHLATTSPRPTLSSTICLRQCHRTMSIRSFRPLAKWKTANWSETKPRVRPRPASLAELSMGPFCVTQSNPTHRLTDPTRPNQIQLTNFTARCNQILSNYRALTALT